MIIDRLLITSGELIKKELLPFDIFKHNSTVRDLMISKIEILKPSMFKPLQPNITRLALQDMNLVVSDYLEFQALLLTSFHMEQLYVQNNNLVIFTNIRAMSNLLLFDASYNKIDRISYADLTGSLLFLILNNNNIQGIGKGELDKLNRLMVLELKNNNISYIEEGAFDRLKELRRLNLKLNYFNIIPNISVLSVLEFLDLSYQRRDIKIENYAFDRSRLSNANHSFAS